MFARPTALRSRAAAGIASSESPSPPRSRRSRLVACVQVIVLTGLWIGLGLWLDLDERLYVALGIPLIAAFQLFVRHRPLADLWVRDGDRFALDRRARLIAAALVIYPLIALGITLAQGEWLNALMAACCVPGALAAGYAVRRMHRPWGPTVRAAAVATVIGLGWMTYAIVPDMSGSAEPLNLVARGLHSLLLYLPVGFVLEEVSFRGAVDAHVHRPTESLGWLSALFVSILWALWHIPIDIGSQPIADLVFSLLLVHVTIGVPLSLAWRRSGNLTLPVAAHAVIDAFRDGLSSGT